MGRHKLKEEEKIGWAGKNYFFTSERAEHSVKKAVWDVRGLIKVEYNFFAPVLDGQELDLDEMMAVTKKRIEMTQGRCIYVINSNISRDRAHRNEYYINAQLIIRTNTKPTEKQLRRIEVYITNVKYKQPKKIKTIGRQTTKNNQPVIATNTKTGEETVYPSVKKLAEALNVTINSVYTQISGKRKKIKGYECRYLS